MTNEIDKAPKTLYYLLPAIIAARTDLPAAAKTLFAIILTLSKKTGFCFASNEALALRMGVSPRHVCRLVALLVSLNLVVAVLDPSRRRLYPSPTASAPLVRSVSSYKEEYKKRIRTMKIEESEEREEAEWDL